MDKSNIEEPKVGDVISQDSPWAVAYCDPDMRIRSYMTMGRFTEKEGLSAALTTKDEINRTKALGHDPIGLKIREREILIRHGDRIRKRRLETLKSLRFKPRSKQILENSLSLVKEISRNLTAMMSAAMIASGMIFILINYHLVPLSGIRDYLAIFIPLFATSIAISSLFTSINASRRLASEERHHSVRPLIFISFEEDLEPELQFKQDRPNLISINEGNPPISGTLYIANHGLGVITNLRFFLHDGKSRASFTDSLELIKPGDEIIANTYFAGLWRGPVMTMYSVGEDIYGGKIITTHIFGQESTPAGNQIKIVFNRQLEPNSPLYKRFLAEIY